MAKRMNKEEQDRRINIINKLRSERKSWSEVGKALGISQPGVYQFAKYHNIAGQKPQKIPSGTGLKPPVLRKAGTSPRTEAQLRELILDFARPLVMQEFIKKIGSG